MIATTVFHESFYSFLSPIRYFPQQVLHSSSIPTHPRVRCAATASAARFPPVDTPAVIPHLGKQSITIFLRCKSVSFDNPHSSNKTFRSFPILCKYARYSHKKYRTEPHLYNPHRIDSDLFYLVFDFRCDNFPSGCWFSTSYFTQHHPMPHSGIASHRCPVFL